MVSYNGVHGYLFPAIALAFALLMPTTFSQTTADPTSTPTLQDTPGPALLETPGPTTLLDTAAPTYIPACNYGLSSDTSATCVEIDGVFSSCGELEDACYIGTCVASECTDGGTLKGSTSGITSSCSVEKFVAGDCNVKYTTLEDVQFSCDYSEALECPEVTPAPALALELSGGCALNTCCECYMNIERDIGWAAINCEGVDQLLCGPVDCVAISSGWVTCEYPCTDGTAVTTGSEEFDGWNSDDGRVDCNGGDCVAVLDDCAENTADDDTGGGSTPSPVVVSGSPSPAGDVSPVVEPLSPTDDAPSGDTSSPLTAEERSAATKMGGVRTYALFPFVLPTILTIFYVHRGARGEGA